MTTKFEANSCEVYLFGANYGEELAPSGYYLGVEEKMAVYNRSTILNRHSQDNMGPSGVRGVIKDDNGSLAQWAGDFGDSIRAEIMAIKERMQLVKLFLHGPVIVEGNSQDANAWASRST